MTAPQPTIIATSIGFGGPGIWDWRCGPAYSMALELANPGPRPRICILATAVGDDPAALTAMHHAFSQLDAVVSHLVLFPMPNVADIAGHLRRQDLIWVSGGSTANLLALWRLHGLDSILHDCWQQGVVLMGVSAGSLCWHVGGTTDSFGLPLQAVTNGLGFLPYSNSPHHDAEPERRPTIHRLIEEGTLPDGFATDNGSGLIFHGTELHEAFTEVEGARAYRLRLESGKVVDEPLPTRLIK